MVKYIETVRSAAVRIVRLKRPPANALDIETLQEIHDVFQSLDADPAVRAAVFTGEGRAFSTGLDLKAVPAYGKEDQLRLLDILNRAISVLYRCRVPVVGAINGHAIAGGLVLALCCDWRIAADTGFQVGLTEVKVGIPFPLAAIEVVRAEMSPQTARQFVLFGENVTSDGAVRAGIFDELVPAGVLLALAMEKARRYSELPRGAFSTIKSQLRRPVLTAIDSGIANGEDPLRQGWLSSESLEAAQRMLARKNS